MTTEKAKQIPRLHPNERDFLATRERFSRSRGASLGTPHVAPLLGMTAHPKDAEGFAGRHRRQNTRFDCVAARPKDGRGKSVATPPPLHTQHRRVPGAPASFRMTAFTSLPLARSNPQRQKQIARSGSSLGITISVR